MSYFKRAIFIFLMIGGYVGAACLPQIVSPGASEVIADTISNQYLFTSTQAGCPGASSVKYIVDGSELAGISRVTPFPYLWNPYFLGNGMHTVASQVLDGWNAVIATSPPTTFFVENLLPQNTSPATDITVTTGSVAQFKLNTTLGTVNALITFHGSLPLNGVGAPLIKSGLQSSPMSFTSFASGAGDVIVGLARWQANTGTLTCSDGGDSFTSLTPQPGSGFSIAACYAKNVSGGSHVVTMSNSGGSQFLGAYVREIHNADPTSPLDVYSPSANGSTQTISSNQFTLNFQNEFVMMMAGWAGVPSTVTSSPGYTMYSDASNSTALQEIVPPTSGQWFSTIGITPTVNGSHSGITKVFQAYVGGSQAATSGNTSASTLTLIFDTSQFKDGPHSVVVNATGGNCPGCTDGTWGSMGGWEQQITFANGPLPSSLQASAKEVTLCTLQANCPTSYTETAKIINADNTSSAANISCLSSNTTSVFITGTCTVNSTSTVGTSFVTMTDVGGKTRTIMVNVMLANTLAHFCADGTITTAPYGGCQDVWFADLFHSAPGFNPLNPGQTSSYDYEGRFGPLLASAFTMFETGVPYPNTANPSGVQMSTPTLFQQGFNDYVSIYQGYKSKYGLGWYVIGDNYFRTSDALYQSFYGNYVNWGAGGINPWQWAISRLTGLVMAIGGVDEVTSSWGGNPLAGVDTGGILIGSKYLPNPIGCTSGTLCNVMTVNVGLNPNRRLVVQGTGDPNMDYNSATGATYLTSGTSGTFTFPTPSGVGTQSYSTGSIQPWVINAYTSANVACPPGGGGGIACPFFINYDVFKQIRLATTATPGHVGLSWPSGAAANSIAVIANWCGGPLGIVAGIKMADYCEAYFGPTNLNYLPRKLPLQSDVLFAMGYAPQGMRTVNYAAMDTQTPLIMLTPGTMNDVIFRGYLVNVDHCSGNIITTTVPHKLHNVLPDITRITVKGSSGLACDGNYYVIAIPSDTTLQVVRANNSFSPGATGATVTFQDGTVFTGMQLNVSTTGNIDGSIAVLGSATCPQLKAKKGLTFTVSNSSSAPMNAMSGGWFSGSNANTGCGAASNPWREFANFAPSTGGTVEIVQDNYAHRGSTWELDSDTGVDCMFAGITSAFIWKTGGIRDYTYSSDTNLCDATIVGAGNCFPIPETAALNASFGGSDFNGGGFVQAGVNPTADIARSIEGFVAAQSGDQFAKRFISYGYQPSLLAPDYGIFFEAAIRSGAPGKIQAIQSYADETTSCTADLTYPDQNGVPFNSGGNTMYRVSGTWAGIDPIVAIPANTNSDTKSCLAGEFRVYVAPTFPLAEMQQPTFSYSTSDSPAGTTSVGVQYSYSSLVFDNPSVSSQMLFQTVPCANGSCTLPVDRNIALIYYRLIYLNVNNRIIGWSSVQTL